MNTSNKTFEQVLQEMDVENTLPILKKWNKYDLYISLPIYLLLFGTMLHYFVPEWSAKGYLTAVFLFFTSVFVFKFYERFINKTYGLIYCVVPGYNKARKPALGVLNKWKSILNKPENKMVVLDTFNTMTQEMDKGKSNYKHFFNSASDNHENKAHMQLYFIELYKQYSEYKLTKQVETYKTTKVVEIAQEKSFNFD